jgi:23S rRNA pseudoU1915 N3-methylase RlmH
MLKINDLKFLESLNCAGNRLAFLDVKNNIKLTYLCCSSNKLNTLDVSRNSALTTLDGDDNQLSNLDVSKNDRLVVLNIARNEFSTLELNNVFTRLNDRKRTTESKILFIAGNTGTNNSRHEIAEHKGWRVNSTYLND